MRPAYIAGPYGAPTTTEIERNVRRACAVGAWAALQGYAPIVPHAIGFMGCYGAFDESDPATRVRAIGAGVAMVRLVGVGLGRLLVIERDDGSLSAGTSLEVHTFLRTPGAEQLLTRHTWSGWLAAGVSEVP